MQTLTRGLAALALVTSLATPGIARGDESPALKAAAHFRRGIELYDDGDFAGALVEFNRANRLQPDFHVLYNIGQTSAELHDYAGAIEAFTRYLAEGGDKVPAQRRQQIEVDLLGLMKRAARVRVTSDVQGARVFVRDEPVGSTPLLVPLVLNPGRHEIRVQLGEASAARRIEVAGGDDTEVHIELGEAGRNASRPPGSARKSVGWVLVGAGAAALVTGAVADLLVVPSKIDDFDAARARDDSRAAVSARDGVRTWQTVSIVSYGAGVLLGGVGATLILWPTSDAKTTAGMTLGGRF